MAPTRVSAAGGPLADAVAAPNTNAASATRAARRTTRQRALSGCATVVMTSSLAAAGWLVREAIREVRDRQRWQPGCHALRGSGKPAGNQLLVLGTNRQDEQAPPPPLPSASPSRADHRRTRPAPRDPAGSRPSFEGPGRAAQRPVRSPNDTSCSTTSSATGKTPGHRSESGHDLESRRFRVPFDDLPKRPSPSVVRGPSGSGRAFGQSTILNVTAAPSGRLAISVASSERRRIP